MPETVPRTVAELREAAWRAFTTADKPVTPEWLADAANLTKGGALRFLTGWRTDGRAVPLAVTPPPGPYKTPWSIAVPVAAPEPVAPQAGRRVQFTRRRAKRSRTSTSRRVSTPGMRWVGVPSVCPHRAQESVATHLPCQVVESRRSLEMTGRQANGP
jgi:hypothetical protein